MKPLTPHTNTQEGDESSFWTTLSITEQYLTCFHESKCVPPCHQGADLINVCMSTNDPTFITAGKFNLLTRCILVINCVVAKYKMKMKENTSQMQIFSSTFIPYLKLQFPFLQKWSVFCFLWELLAISKNCFCTVLFESFILGSHVTTFQYYVRLLIKTDCKLV